MPSQPIKVLPVNAEGEHGYLSFPKHYGYQVTDTYSSTALGAIDPATISLPKPFVVVIVGAGKGIGASIAKAYAQAGASGIAISSRTLADLQLVETEILQTSPKTQVLCHTTDVADEASVIALASKVKETFGRLDAAVINAGTSPRFISDKITGKKRFPFGTIEQSTDDYMRVWNINFHGTYYCQKHFLPLLIQTKNGAQALVCVSSSSSHTTSTELSPFVYNFSKIAVNRLVETIHEAYSKDGIVAYALHPGAIQTPLTTEYPEEWDTILVDDISLPGGFCVWLTKSKKEWLSGRYVSTNWNTEELEAQKEDIVAGDKFKFRMVV